MWGYLPPLHSSLHFSYLLFYQVKEDNQAGNISHNTVLARQREWPFEEKRDYSESCSEIRVPTYTVCVALWKLEPLSSSSLLPVCGDILRSSGQLVRHLVLEASPPPICCVFSWQLVRHSGIAETIPTPLCCLCGWWYSLTSWQLVRHSGIA